MAQISNNVDEEADGGLPPRTGSPSYLTRETGWHAEYLKASDRALQMEIERNDARRDRDEWKASAEQYHRANEMLALLRRIARKGEFMDREGLRLVVSDFVSDWLARRHLLQENEKTQQPAPTNDETIEPDKTPIWKIEQNTAQRNTPKNS